MATYNNDKFPVKRIGNERNPEIIILLSNPAGNPEKSKQFPEYTMSRDGGYSEIGMDLKIFREYCQWWDRLLTVTDDFDISPSSVLAIEYYPYHTTSSNEIPPRCNWTKFAAAALDENIKIIKKFQARGIPVFGYYWGEWQWLIDGFYKSLPCRGPYGKMAELEKFLKKYIK